MSVMVRAAKEGERGTWSNSWSSSSPKGIRRPQLQFSPSFPKRKSTKALESHRGGIARCLNRWARLSRRLRLS